MTLRELLNEVEVNEGLLDKAKAALGMGKEEKPTAPVVPAKKPGEFDSCEEAQKAYHNTAKAASDGHPQAEKINDAAYAYMKKNGCK